jgi:hypothetical protein
MRKGFGLITAIIILVIVSTLMTLMISLSSTSVKQTSDIYFKEQAELLARSVVEYGLLAISGHENNTSCIENINVTYQNAYEANLTFYYLYAGAAVPICNHVLASGISTEESNMTTIIDVRVAVRQDTTGITEPIVIQRRTIQKP